MKAEIISIGDELLIGQVTNTNASYLGDQLSTIGVSVARITTVGDDHDTLLAAFSRAREEHDIVITTGGLGPTHDDITREAVTEFFRTELIFSEQVFEDISRFVRQRGRTMRAIHEDQAMVPSGASVMRNPDGTAPGYHFENGGKHFFVTPGVPYEMKGMLERNILFCAGWL